MSKKKPVYEMCVRCKWLGDKSKTLAEIADRLSAQARALRRMHKDGLRLKDPMRDDYAYIETRDPALANKWGMSLLEDFGDPDAI